MLAKVHPNLAQLLSRERAQREPVAHQLDPSRAGDVPQHLVLVDRQIRWPNEVRFVSSQRGVEVRDSLPVKRESVDAYHCVTSARGADRRAWPERLVIWGARS